MKIFLFLYFIFISVFCFPQDFEQQPFPGRYRLFDIGVYCESGNFNFFTANHNALQTILIGDGAGNFSDNQLSVLRLDQDSDFPGLEVGNPPEISEEGLYIYWTDMDLFVIFRKGNNCQTCNFEMVLTSEIDIIENDHFYYEKTEVELPGGLIETTLQVSSYLDSSMRIDPNYRAVPIDFEISLSVNYIFVGNKKVIPESSQFTIQLQDRHGHAWGDYNLDGETDVFIVRGGLQGDMAKFPESYNYELFQGDPFADVIDQTGIDMKYSRSRQVAMVDYNNDGLPDYYVGCKETENQLWEQQTDGTFVDVADQYGLDKNMTGQFRWFDWQQDNDMDLVMVNTKGFLLFKNTGTGFEKIIIYEFGGDYESYNISMGDIDNDLDLDCLLSSFEGNLVIRNDGTEMVRVDPSVYELPGSSANAVMVDIWNDGDQDVWTPDGIYKQRVTKKFVYETDEIAIPYQADVVLCAWADFDNNGTRDCILAYEKENQLFEWQSKYYKNLITKNNWIELNFLSEDLGTKVTITAGDLMQYSEVGAAENSRFSQGHYRLYFGLKEQNIIDRIEIRRLNGTIEIIENVAPNQILF